MFTGIFPVLQENLSNMVIGIECDSFRTVLLPQSQAPLVMKPRIVADVCNLPFRDTVS